MRDQPRIDLVYDPDCPNVDRARKAIRDALTAIGGPVVWLEWRRLDAATPLELRALGSPSVLVNGRDVGCDAGTLAAAEFASCRIYADECGCIGGAPSAALILKTISALRSAESV